MRRKEIMVISLTTALILNVVLSRRITTSRVSNSIPYVTPSKCVNKCPNCRKW